MVTNRAATGLSKCLEQDNALEIGEKPAAMAYSVSIEVVVDVFLAALCWHRCPEGSAPALSRPKWPQRSASLGLEMVIRQDFAGFSRDVGGEVSNDNEAMKPGGNSGQYL